MTLDGFDLDSSLVCEGIIGDGCGGGRLFFVEDERLFAYDPITKERFMLLSGIVNAKSISKDACIITILSACDDTIFDLSKLERVKQLP